MIKTKNGKTIIKGRNADVLKDFLSIFLAIAEKHDVLCEMLTLNASGECGRFLNRVDNSMKVVFDNCKELQDLFDMRF